MMTKNPFNHSSKLLFTLSLLWTGVLLLIGGWWVFFMINFEEFLVNTQRERITKMLAWEGGSFIILLLLISVSILILYLKDKRKTHSLQAFFASLTHELKTPLASIRLQGEVINEILESKKDPTLDKLIGRLIDDTAKLETQMDKILQLSRIERGGELNLTPITLLPLIKKLIKTWLPDVEVELTSQNGIQNGILDEKLKIEADEFALELILKNLMENTRLHTQSQKIKMMISSDKNYVYLNYMDQGEFSGKIERLGSLFYKHNSSKGSGIGLYLSQKLLEKMGGYFLITKKDKGLSFNLTFKKSEESRA